MTMSLNVRRLLASACIVLGLLFALLFVLVAVSKITVLSVVSITALALYGGTACTLFLAARALLRRP